MSGKVVSWSTHGNISILVPIPYSKHCNHMACSSLSFGPDTRLVGTVFFFVCDFVIDVDVVDMKNHPSSTK